MGKSVPTELIKGVSSEGRSAAYKRKGLWAIKKKNGGKFPVIEKKAKAEAAAGKSPKFYPADDVHKPLPRRILRRPTKLRESITPGTVLILVAGRFKGKRVVFLKQLASGLLLVTGPYNVNGVPLRRVNQVYAIATSTKIEVSKVDSSKFEDAYFKAPTVKRTKKGEDAFFETETEKKPLAAAYIENQKNVDAALGKVLSEEQKGYLKARFSLSSGDKPHLMKF